MQPQTGVASPQPLMMPTPPNLRDGARYSSKPDDSSSPSRIIATGQPPEFPPVSHHGWPPRYPQYMVIPFMPHSLPMSSSQGVAVPMPIPQFNSPAMVPPYMMVPMPFSVPAAYPHQGIPQDVSYGSPRETPHEAPQGPTPAAQAPPQAAVPLAVLDSGERPDTSQTSPGQASRTEAPPQSPVSVPHQAPQPSILLAAMLQEAVAQSSGQAPAVPAQAPQAPPRAASAEPEQVPPPLPFQVAPPAQLASMPPGSVPLAVQIPRYASKLASPGALRSLPSAPPAPPSLTQAGSAASSSGASSSGAYSSGASSSGSSSFGSSTAASSSGASSVAPSSAPSNDSFPHPQIPPAVLPQRQMRLSSAPSQGDMSTAHSATAFPGYDASAETDDEPVEDEFEYASADDQLKALVKANDAMTQASRQHDMQNSEESRMKYMLLRATHLSQTEKYITSAISRAHDVVKQSEPIGLKPRDRRYEDLPTNWSRRSLIMKNPEMHTECRRLVRGSQGCGRECDDRFANLLEFAEHIDEKHPRSFRPFCCPAPKCPWSVIGFHERSECTRHIRTKHFQAMYACEFRGCKKIYNRSDAFRRHVRQAHGVVDDVRRKAVVQPVVPLRLKDDNSADTSEDEDMSDEDDSDDTVDSE